MNRILFLAVLCMAQTTAIYAGPTRIPLSQAIQQHIVTISAEATGNSYMQQGLKLTVKNTGSLNFILVLNQGVIFTPAEENVQPLILAGEEIMPMQPLKEATISVQTFCANSSATAPEKGMKYTYQKMAGDNLLKLLGFLKQNRMYNELGQNAVWHFTNGHSLNTVYDPTNGPSSKKLIEFITTLTGEKQPEYFVQTSSNTTAGQPVHNPKALKIFATFEEELAATKTLTLGIYNEQGDMVQPVFENRNFPARGHRFRVEFEAQNVPVGKYYIRLKEGDTTLREKMVEVE
ncbi:MAG: hypothetical protein K8F30_08910 [Taibaiella sp.]|nr:hypothetical protein [Taibaiella sp.]